MEFLKTFLEFARHDIMAVVMLFIGLMFCLSIIFCKSVRDLFF